MNKTVVILVSGRVQGVFYRQSTKQKALGLGLDGSAINLPNGDVEVIVKGHENAVTELINWCRIGPPAAKVTAVKVEESNYKVSEGFLTG